MDLLTYLLTYLLTMEIH